MQFQGMDYNRRALLEPQSSSTPRYSNGPHSSQLYASRTPERQLQVLQRIDMNVENRQTQPYSNVSNPSYPRSVSPLFDKRAPSSNYSQNQQHQQQSPFKKIMGIKKTPQQHQGNQFKVLSHQLPSSTLLSQERATDTSFTSILLNSSSTSANAHGPTLAGDFSQLCSSSSSNLSNGGSYHIQRPYHSPAPAIQQQSQHVRQSRHSTSLYSKPHLNYSPSQSHRELAPTYSTGGGYMQNQSYMRQEQPMHIQQLPTLNIFGVSNVNSNHLRDRSVDDIPRSLHLEQSILVNTTTGGLIPFPGAVSTRSQPYQHLKALSSYNAHVSPHAALPSRTNSSSNFLGNQRFIDERTQQQSQVNYPRQASTAALTIDSRSLSPATSPHDYTQFYTMRPVIQAHTQQGCSENTYRQQQSIIADIPNTPNSYRRYNHFQSTTINKQQQQQPHIPHRVVQETSSPNNNLLLLHSKSKSLHSPLTMQQPVAVVQNVSAAASQLNHQQQILAKCPKLQKMIDDLRENIVKDLENLTQKLYKEQKSSDYSGSITSSSLTNNGMPIQLAEYNLGNDKKVRFSFSGKEIITQMIDGHTPSSSRPTMPTSSNSRHHRDEDNKENIIQTFSTPLTSTTPQLSLYQQSLLTQQIHKNNLNALKPPKQQTAAATQHSFLETKINNNSNVRGSVFVDNLDSKQLAMKKKTTDITSVNSHPCSSMCRDSEEKSIGQSTDRSASQSVATPPKRMRQSSSSSSTSSSASSSDPQQASSSQLQADSSSRRAVSSSNREIVIGKQTPSFERSLSTMQQQQRLAQLVLEGSTAESLTTPFIIPTPQEERQSKDREEVPHKQDEVSIEEEKKIAEKGEGEVDANDECFAEEATARESLESPAHFAKSSSSSSSRSRCSHSSSSSISSNMKQEQLSISRETCEFLSRKKLLSLIGNGVSCQASNGSLMNNTIGVTNEFSYSSTSSSNTPADNSSINITVCASARMQHSDQSKGAHADSNNSSCFSLNTVVPLQQQQPATLRFSTYLRQHNQLSPKLQTHTGMFFTRSSGADGGGVTAQKNSFEFSEQKKKAMTKAKSAVSLFEEYTSELLSKGDEQMGVAVTVIPQAEALLPDSLITITVKQITTETEEMISTSYENPLEQIRENLHTQEEPSVLVDLDAVAADASGVQYPRFQNPPSQHQSACKSTTTIDAANNAEATNSILEKVSEILSAAAASKANNYGDDDEESNGTATAALTETTAEFIALYSSTSQILVDNSASDVPQQSQEGDLESSIRLKGVQMLPPRAPTSKTVIGDASGRSMMKQVSVSNSSSVVELRKQGSSDSATGAHNPLDLSCSNSKKKRISFTFNTPPQLLREAGENDDDEYEETVAVCRRNLKEEFNSQPFSIAQQQLGTEEKESIHPDSIIRREGEEEDDAEEENASPKNNNNKKFAFIRVEKKEEEENDSEKVGDSHLHHHLSSNINLSEQLICDDLGGQYPNQPIILRIVSNKRSSVTQSKTILKKSLIGSPTSQARAESAKVRNKPTEQASTSPPSPLTDSSNQKSLRRISFKDKIEEVYNFECESRSTSSRSPIGRCCGILTTPRSQNTFKKEPYFNSIKKFPGIHNNPALYQQYKTKRAKSPIPHLDTSAFSEQQQSSLSSSQSVASTPTVQFSSITPTARANAFYGKQKPDLVLKSAAGLNDKQSIATSITPTKQQTTFKPLTCFNSSSNKTPKLTFLEYSKIAKKNE